MIHRIRLRAASQMQADRFSDHHTCVMPPEEAIIVGKGSIASFAIPALLDA